MQHGVSFWGALRSCHPGLYPHGHWRQDGSLFLPLSPCPHPPGLCHNPGTPPPPPPPLLAAESEEPPRALSRPLSLLPYPSSSAPHPTSSLPPPPIPLPCIPPALPALPSEPGPWGLGSPLAVGGGHRGVEHLSLVCLLGWPWGKAGGFWAGTEDRSITVVSAGLETGPGRDTLTSWG